MIEFVGFLNFLCLNLNNFQSNITSLLARLNLEDTRLGKWDMSC